MTMKSILFLLMALAGLNLLGCAQTGASSTEGSRMNADGAPTGRMAPSGSERAGGPSTRGSYEPLNRVPVTRGEGGIPAECSSQAAVGLMTHFVSAFNEGDGSKLKRLFPSRASVMPWLYSVNRGSKVEFMTDNRDALIGYFAERHAKNDRLEVVSIEVRPSSATSNGTARADVTYSINRRADDLRDTSESHHRVTGKSVMDCRRQVLVLTSMETRV